MDPAFIQQGLEAIFKRSFSQEIVNGERVYFTDVPHHKVFIPTLGGFPQFLFYNHHALKELGTLGYAYLNQEHEPRYWGIKESDLNGNVDYLLDALNKNKNAPRMDDYTPDMHEEMENFFNPPRSLCSYHEKNITPYFYAQYMLSVLQGKMAKQKGWEYRKDNIVFQSEYLKLSPSGVKNDKRLDLNLLAHLVQMYTDLTSVPGLTPVLTVLKYSTQPLDTLIIASNDGPPVKSCEPNLDYKKNHAKGVYGVGYNVEGFEELDAIHRAIEEKLAINPQSSLNGLTYNIRSNSNAAKPLSQSFCKLDMDNLKLPLKTDEFLYFTPEELFCKNPLSVISGMKKAIQLTTNHSGLKKL